MKKNDALKEIILKKKERLVSAKQAFPEETLKERIKALEPARPFAKAINKPHAISLIAEIKKASPSRGVIRQDFDPQAIARVYQESGAQAVSVLTEEDFFLGSPSFINEVKNAVALPVLRKDFILEPYQVYESRFLGADAILLIADILSKEKLEELAVVAGEVGLECLIEAHAEKELKKALSLKAGMIGINNRDLHTLAIDLKTTERLFPLIPKDKTVVVESGLTNYQDVLFLKILGVEAVLIGQALMEAGNTRGKIEEIMGW